MGQIYIFPFLSKYTEIDQIDKSATLMWLNRSVAIINTMS